MVIYDYITPGFTFSLVTKIIRLTDRHFISSGRDYGCSKEIEKSSDNVK